MEKRDKIITTFLTFAVFMFCAYYIYRFYPITSSKGIVVKFRESGMPERLTNLHYDKARKWGINPITFSALTKVESAWDERAYRYNSNGTKDLGLGQINKVNQIAGINYWDAEANLEETGRLYSELLKSSGNSEELAYLGYVYGVNSQPYRTVKKFQDIREAIKLGRQLQ